MVRGVQLAHPLGSLNPALGGHSIHVGTDGSYVALYTPPEDLKQADGAAGQPNHIGVLVEGLDATEIKVRAAGYQLLRACRLRAGARGSTSTISGGVEIEVVSYS